MQKAWIAGLALGAALAIGAAPSANAQTVRTNDFLTGCGTATGCVVDSTTVNDTWGDDEDTVILDAPVFVKDGGVLTILPGVDIRGNTRFLASSGGVTAGVPGSIIVTQTGRIDAQGAASSADVIIMTTAAVDNGSAPGGVGSATGDGIADDFDGDSFPDPWPGYDPLLSGTPAGTLPCTPGPGAGATIAGVDNILGTGDDQLGDCVLSDYVSALGGADTPGVLDPVYLDDTPRTAPLAPLNPAGFENVSLWGGVVILGEAPTNTVGATGGDIGQGIVEGLPVPGFPAADAIYGGSEPHDSSGVMRYVSVRHAGDEIGNSNELNGVTLGAVGDGTIFEYVEVYANFDDGFEWFGGTVNSNHLMVALVGDDSLDMDQGYTGVTQFALSVSPWFNEEDGGSYGSASGDKAGEWDGDDCAGGDCNLAGPDNTVLAGVTDTGTGLGTDCDSFGVGLTPSPLPMSSGMVYNYTVLGNSIVNMPGPVDYDPNGVCTGASTPLACCSGVGTGSCTASENEGVEMRNGFAGELRNSYVVNTGSEEGLDISFSDGSATCWNATQNGCSDRDGDGFGDLVRVLSSTFARSAIDDDSSYCDVGGADSQDALDNGDAVTGAGPITGNAAASTARLGNEDTTFDPTGSASGKIVAALKSAAINPRPPGGLGTIGGVSAGGHPVPSPGVTYRGAFAPTEPTLWTTGWTVLSLGGVLAP